MANIIITGASRGLGLAMVKAFLTDTDHQIIAISRNASGLFEFNQLKGNDSFTFSTLIPYTFDINEGSFGELFEFVSLYMSSVDVLINNAGFLVNKPFELLTEDDYLNTFNTNVRGVFRIVRALFPLFGKGSHIVNISSMGGFQGSVKFPGLSLYSASKGALSVLTECLAEEFKDRGIKVNALALGSVQTEMLSQAFPGYQAPLQPHEMAEFIKDFSLNGRKYFNGKILPVSVTTP